MNIYTLSMVYFSFFLTAMESIEVCWLCRKSQRSREWFPQLSYPSLQVRSHGLVLIFGFYISANIMHGHTLSNNRYARTGNCNMAAFKRDDGTIDFVTAMLEDVSSYTFMLKSCQFFCQAYTLNRTLSFSRIFERIITVDHYVH